MGVGHIATGPRDSHTRAAGGGGGRGAVTGGSHGASPAVICSRASCGSANPIPFRGPAGPTLDPLWKCSPRGSRGDAHLEEETAGRGGEAAPPTARGDRREEQVEFAGCHSQRPHQRGRGRPRVGRAAGPAAAAAGLWPRVPPTPSPAPLLWSVFGVSLDSRSPSPLQSSSPGSDQHVAIWGSCVIM